MSLINTRILVIVVLAFLLPIILMFWNTRKETSFRRIAPKIILIAFGMGMTYGFLNHPDQEPNDFFRYFEISTIYLLTNIGVMV